MTSIKKGDVFSTNNFGEVEVIEYIAHDNVVCRFVGYQETFTTQSRLLRNGKIKNHFKPSVWGVGYLGKGDSKTTKKSYKTWSGMLERCYSNEYQSKKPTYVGCTVVDEWHNYQTFKTWFDANHVEGCQLDKDILVKGNKIYSPSTCIFIPSNINNLFTNTSKHENTGVYKVQGRYRAVCNNGNGKNKFLGSFSTLEMAQTAYNNYKNDLIRELSATHTEPLKSALLNHINEENHG